MSIKNPQLSNVSSPRGAPMGRPTRAQGFETKARCFRLRFIDQAYDEGGAYWGMPANVYCAMNDVGLQLFCRARDRAHAKRKFEEEYPQLKWVK